MISRASSMTTWSIFLFWVLSCTVAEQKQYYETSNTYEEYPNDDQSQALLATQPLDGEIPKIKLELWTTADDFRNPLFDLVKGIVRRLDKDLLQFEPSYFIQDGLEVGCRLVDPATMQEVFNGAKQECSTNCTNAGRYCAASKPRNPALQGRVGGYSILEESLRRLCIWVVYGKVGGENSLHFFRYVDDELFATCDDPFGKTCVYTVMDRVDVSPHFIERCMNHTSGLDTDSGLDTEEQNAYFEQELDKLDELTLDMIPAIKIGKNLYIGPETTEDIFRALCATYPANRQPIACDFCKSCSDVRYCLWNLNCDGTTFDMYAAAKMLGDASTTTTTSSSPDPLVANTTTPLSTATPVSSEATPATAGPIETLNTPAPPAPADNTPSPQNTNDYDFDDNYNREEAKKMAEAKDAMISGIVLGLVVGLMISGVFACRDWQAKLVLYEIKKEGRLGVDLRMDNIFASPNNSQAIVASDDIVFKSNQLYSDDPNADAREAPQIRGF